jgi:hypothetical protein
MDRNISIGDYVRFYLQPCFGKAKLPCLGTVIAILSEYTTVKSLNGYKTFWNIDDLEKLTDGEAMLFKLENA